MSYESPRTVDYFVLRACERFRISPAGFDGLGYDEQLRLLAFDQVRREEMGSAGRSRGGAEG
jgi:hypothetical protein